MFKLDFNIPPATKKINLKHPLLLIGSCFSDEIGHKLGDNKFNALSNPFGTIYNPHSIFKLLMDDFSSSNLVENQGIFYHWDAHGSISALSKEEAVQSVEEKKNHTKGFLDQAQWLIITLGTALVYETSDSRIVANCHKIPSTHFKKRFLTVEEIEQQFNKLQTYLSSINPGLNVIFTVSPVRHVRDGLIENNRSKAILINAIHQISDKYANISYFPAYEIVIDELRDYRFYSRDMIHPSEEAIDYVWKKFVASYFDSETLSFLEEWSKLKTSIDHKPFHTQSTAHQEFLQSMIKKLERMDIKIDVSTEIKNLKSQII